MRYILTFLKNPIINLTILEILELEVINVMILHMGGRLLDPDEMEALIQLDNLVTFYRLFADYISQGELSFNGSINNIRAINAILRGKLLLI